MEQLFAEEGAHAGGEFKQEPSARRLANLVNKGRVFEEAISPRDARVYGASSVRVSN